MPDAHKHHTMSKSQHVCSGCGATIERAMDMEKVEGDRRRSWRCQTCKTAIPSVVAERISHQQQ